MKRIHLFEFEDQHWFPKQFRSLITDLLQHLLTSLNIYSCAVDKIKQVLKITGCNQIIDLCSGSAGSILQIQKMLEKQGLPVSVILSDKYPNLESFSKICNLSEARINFICKPVDAASIPPEYQCVRTLFSAFHHFRPEKAQKILQDAVNQKAPICIFEFTERSLFNLLRTPLYFCLVLFQTPFIRPFKWSRLFWTYIIPIAPLCYSWDAMVSHLRTYSSKELKQMVAEIKNENYYWEIGQLKSETWGFIISYLIG